MEANIVVAGVPRRLDSQENARRISSAVASFHRRYPGAIIERPTVQLIGAESQTISFAVQGSDLSACQGMQSYFEQQLLQAGFSPEANAGDADATTDALFRMLAGGSGAAHVRHPPQAEAKPWWKFW